MYYNPKAGFLSLPVISASLSSNSMVEDGVIVVFLTALQVVQWARLC